MTVSYSKRQSSQQSGQLPQGLGAGGMAVLLVSAAMTMIDFFIVNVALASMGVDLHADQASLEWVVAGYGGAYAVMLVMGGRLGDAIGRRRTAIIGLVAFTAASAVCGLAPTIEVLIAARVLQGVSAALLLPQTLATIRATTVGEAQSRAIGLYGAIGGLSAALGQVVGGVLVAANLAGLEWRPIFLINVVVGVLLLFGMVFVPETRSEVETSFDGPGTLLFGLVMVALFVPATVGPMLGWPWWSWLCLVAAVLASVALITVERRTEGSGRSALLPPSLLKAQGVRSGLVALIVLCVAFGGYAFAFSLSLQHGRHFSALASGMSLLPMAIGAFLASLVSARFMKKLGVGTIAIGGAVQAAGLAWVAVSAGINWLGLTPWHLLPGMLLIGVGNGLLLTMLYRVILRAVPANQAGAGSGVLNTAQQMALTLGVATVGSLFSVVQARSGDQAGLITVAVIWAITATAVAVFSWVFPDPRPQPQAVALAGEEAKS